MYDSRFIKLVLKDVEPLQKILLYKSNFFPNLHFFILPQVKTQLSQSQKDFLVIRQLPNF